jgi:hypothetical protein
MQGNWFWNNKVMDAIEKGLLNLTHWIWNKRHNSTEIENSPAPAVKVEPKVDTAVVAKKPAARKTATKKAPKGSEWSVK